VPDRRGGIFIRGKDKERHGKELFLERGERGGRGEGGFSPHAHRKGKKASLSSGKAMVFQEGGIPGTEKEGTRAYQEGKGTLFLIRGPETRRKEISEGVK